MPYYEEGGTDIINQQTLLVIDNTPFTGEKKPELSTGIVRYVGSWQSSQRTSSGYYGENYVSSGSYAPSDAYFRFLPNFPSDSVTRATNSAFYKVYLRWPADSNRPKAARVVIQYINNQSQNVTIDQTTNGNQWVYLGEFEFAVGTADATNQSVTLYDDEYGYLAADAVMFRRVL